MSNTYTQDNKIAPNVVPYHGFYGDPDMAKMRPDSHGDNIAPATWSTTPYKPPPRRDRDNPDRALCAFEGCGAFPSEKAGGDYCTGHARQLGLAPRCAQTGCKGAPWKDSKFCYPHSPKVQTDGDTG